MLIRILMLIILTSQAQAELYRCESSTGQIQYTDQPCTETGTTYKPKPVMTHYKTIKTPKFHHKKTSTNTSSNNQPCPFISSTELRTLRVKDTYKKGLTQAQIKQRLGKADDINNSKNSSTWVYKGEYVKRSFRFKNGCLISWKEKWKGKESKISKFRDEK
ncbi:DUF4124 domain-containing protein [Pseudomonas sp. HK3]